MMKKEQVIRSRDVTRFRDILGTFENRCTKYFENRRTKQIIKRREADMLETIKAD